MSPTSNAAAVSAMLKIGPNDYPVHSFSGEEAVNQPFFFTLRLQNLNLIQAENLVGQSCQFTIFCAASGYAPSDWPASRTINGIITRRSVLNPHLDKSLLIELDLESHLSVLKLSGTPRVFKNQTACEVVEQILVQHGFKNHQLCFQNVRLQKTAQYPYWVQAQDESDFMFIQRVLAREGMSYFWAPGAKGLHDTLTFFENWFLSPHMNVSFFLTESDGGIHSIDINSLFSLQLKESPTSYQITYRDYNPQSPATMMEAHAGEGKRRIIVWGFGAQSFNHLQRAARHHHERLCMNEKVFTATTHNPYCLTGHVFSIAQLPPSIENNGFKLLKLSHHFKQGAYHNHLTFVPKNTPYRPDIIKQDAGQLMHTARIHSTDERPCLDKSGQYTYSTHLHNPEANPDTLQTASRLTPFGGHVASKVMGIHFPLRKQTEVLVMYLHNDFNQAILQNSPSNGLNHAPVTQTNSWDTLLKTAWNQYLKFCDRKGQESIMLANADSRNRLHINLEKNNHHIDLACDRGPLSLNAITRYTLNGKETITANIDRHLSIKTNENNHFIANDFHLQATSQAFNAARTLSINTGGRIEASAQQMDINSDGDMSIQATGQCLTLNLPNGDIVWQVDDLVLKANDALHVATTDAGIKLDSAGITIHGTSIALSGAVIKAPPSDTSNPVPPLMPPTAPASIIPANTRYFAFGFNKTIKPPNWESTFYQEEDTAYIEVTIKRFDGNETGTLTIVRYHHADRFAALLEYPSLNQLKTATAVDSRSFTLGHTYLYPDKQQAEKTPGSATLRIPYPLHNLYNKANPRDKNAIKHDPYYVRVTIGDTAGCQYSNAMILLTKADITIIHDKDRPYRNKQSILSIKRALPTVAKTHPQCPLLLESRYYGAPTRVEQLPLGTRNKVQLKEKGAYRELLRSDYTLPLPSQRIDVTHNGHGATTLTRLMPPLIVNLHDAKMADSDVVFDSNEPNARVRLTDEEIAYIKANGNNLTVFIHGYNVAPGRFDKHMDSIYEDYSTMPVQGYAPLHQYIRAKYSDADATIFRDLDFLEEQFEQDSRVKETVRAKYNWLNGEGACEWVIHFEHNLNRAAGFDGKNYQKFSRCLFIQWPGNPSSVLDYMAAASESARMGPIVAAVFQNLQSQIDGLKLHVVAHSQGNGVLLHALEKHGKAGLKPLDHVFFWQAAIPKNALSNKKTADTDPLWFCPNAYKGANKITVLHSKNDNVLGPLLHQDEQPEGVKLKDVWKRKPGTELVVALVAKALCLKSIYIVANWLGMPISMLFEEQTLAASWTKWIEKHPFIYCGGVAHRCMSTLAEQKHLLSKIQLKQNLHENYQTRLHTELKDSFDLLKEYSRLDKSLDLVMNGTSKLLTSFFSQLFNQIDNTKSAMQLVLTNLFADFKPLLDDMITFEQSALELNVIQGIEAMGYGGPDEDDPFIKGLNQTDKLNIINATKWVWQHSDMKIPSNDILNNLYEEEIFKKISFGLYPVNKEGQKK